MEIWLVLFSTNKKATELFIMRKNTNKLQTNLFNE